MALNKIGFIGLGTMGIPMCRSLLNASYKLTVFNRDSSKAEGLVTEGACIALNPADLINQTDVVIIMVTDDNAINELFKGENGLFGTNASEKIIINMSTVSPAISKEIALQCEERGNHYIDAPVSGSVKQATEGTLVILAGGDLSIFEEVRLILETIGSLAIHFGEVGSGNEAKLVVNAFLAVQAQALAEAFVFADGLALSKPDLMNVLNNSALGSPFVKIKGDAVLKDSYKPAFTFSNTVKDLRLASDIGMSSPLGIAALETFSSSESDYGKEDIIAIFKALSPNK